MFGFIFEVDEHATHVDCLPQASHFLKPGLAYIALNQKVLYGFILIIAYIDMLEVSYFVSYMAKQAITSKVFNSKAQGVCF